MGHMLDLEPDDCGDDSFLAWLDRRHPDLGEKAAAARIDGELLDLTTPPRAGRVEILTFEDEAGREVYRHTASHVMSRAVQQLFPDARLAIGPAIIIVTFGPCGSYFQIADGSALVPAFAVETVDATGCGDAFIAGLLCQLVRTGDWRGNLSVDQMRAAVTYANAVGALTSTSVGVIPALPERATVDEFLRGLD